jgi:glycerophosphoryl diester phosphodiesterase
VNDRSQIESVLALGVDGVITDAADVLRDVLIARGQWPQRASADRPATGQRG